MFDFLKKRFTAKVPEAAYSAQQSDLAEKTRDAIKLANQRSGKQDELARAAGFAGQEDAALAFILQSDYADARLQAAMHIHSREALMQVSRAMRNTDRRVTKLAQDKLAKLQNKQKMNLAVQACLSQGQQLLATMPLMANQVAQWDKQRLALDAHDASQMLVQTKAELENRLQAQFDLQRQVLQVAGKLRSLVETNVSPEQAQATLAEGHQEWQEIQSSPLLASLPKNQLQQLPDDLAKAQSHVEQLIQRDAVIEDNSEPDEETEQETEQETNQQTKQHETKQQPEPVKTTPVDVAAVLMALENALQEGSLQQALDLDKSLRKANVPTRGDIAQRLATVRAELNRLLDWAKWGGNISREELINVADKLATAELAAPEIAKQIGGLRSRWKELDRTSGVAAHALWERFDAACNSAYKIADAYFKQQAQLRLTNLGLAEAQLAAMDEVILDMQNRLPDWKAHQNYINKVKLEWRKLGTIDRKLRAQLNAAFDQKLIALLQPLTAARAAAAEVRHQLIKSVSEIVATERDAVEKVQQLQQRWQQEALNLPLERNDEQALWHQFRAACDAVFVQRKANLDEQHQRRNQLIFARQACCEELEKTAATATESGSEIVQVLRKAKQEWRDLSGGKHKQDDLDVRFNAAVTQLEQRQSELLAKEKKTALMNLCAKINLCRQIETETVDRSAAWQAEWALLDTSLLPAELNKLLTQRFNNALAAPGNQQTTNVNSAQIEEQLLRIELLRGLPSPPEFAQQRLQLQVQELQSALKNRDVNSNYQSNFYALCEVPGILNSQQEQRFQAILDNYCNQ